MYYNYTYNDQIRAFVVRLALFVSCYQYLLSVLTTFKALRYSSA